MPSPPPIPVYIHPLPDQLPAHELVEQSAKVELSYGSQEIQRYFFDGIQIDHLRHRFNDHYLFHRENPGGVVSLGFNLKGSYDIHQLGHTYRVHAGQHNIIHTRGYSNTLENKDLEAESFSIIMQPQFFYEAAREGNSVLKRFLGEMVKDKPVVLAPESLYTDVELEQAIRAILDCPFSGSMKKMYLLSKSIEILVLQAEAFDRAARRSSPTGLRESDKRKLAEAKAYLEAHISDPPSLSELTRIAGINEYKLKRGFKELYGNTVFGHLSNFRLERAKSELQEGSKAIGEIAATLGYSSSQHFSRAFKEKFGIPPGKFRRPN